MAPCDASNNRCHFINLGRSLVLYVVAVAVRITEIKHIYSERHVNALHHYILKQNIIKNASLSTSAPCLDTKSPVCADKFALGNPYILYSACSLGANRYTSMSPLKLAVADLHMLSNFVVLQRHIILATLDCHAVISNGDHGSQNPYIAAALRIKSIRVG